MLFLGALILLPFLRFRYKRWKRNRAFEAEVRSWCFDEGWEEVRELEEKNRQKLAENQRRLDKLEAAINEWSKKNDEEIATRKKQIADLKIATEEAKRAGEDCERATVSLVTSFVGLAHTMDATLEAVVQRSNQSQASNTGTRRSQASNTGTRRRPCRVRGYIRNDNGLQ